MLPLIWCLIVSFVHGAAIPMFGIDNDPRMFFPGISMGDLKIAIARGDQALVASFLTFVNPSDHRSHFVRLGLPVVMMFAEEGSLKRYKDIVPSPDGWEPAELKGLLLKVGLETFIDTFPCHFQALLKCPGEVKSILPLLSQSESDLMLFTSVGFKLLHPQYSFHHFIKTCYEEGAFANRIKVKAFLCSPLDVNWRDKELLLPMLQSFAQHQDPEVVAFTDSKQCFSAVLCFREIARLSGPEWNRLTKVFSPRFLHSVPCALPKMKFWRNLVESDETFSMEQFSTSLGTTTAWRTLHFPRVLQAFSEHVFSLHVSTPYRFHLDKEESREAYYTIAILCPQVFIDRPIKTADEDDEGYQVILKCHILLNFKLVFAMVRDQADIGWDDEKKGQLMESGGSLQRFIELKQDGPDPDFRLLGAIFSTNEADPKRLFERAMAEQDYFLAKFIGHVIIRKHPKEAIQMIRRFLALKQYPIVDEYLHVYAVPPGYLCAEICTNEPGTIPLFNDLYGSTTDLESAIIPGRGLLLVEIARMLGNSDISLELKSFMPFFGEWSTLLIIHCLGNLDNKAKAKLASSHII